MHHQTTVADLLLLLVYASHVLFRPLHRCHTTSQLFATHRHHVLLPTVFYFVSSLTACCYRLTVVCCFVLNLLTLFDWLDGYTFRLLFDYC